MKARKSQSYIISALLLAFSTPLQADIAGSFSTAKKWAHEDIYHDRRITFYCGCSYNKEKEVNQASCGYSPRSPLTNSGNENTRDNRIEWEHVLPASVMGSHLACWGDERGQFQECHTSSGDLYSGRDCCQKVNRTYEKAHNDLINLTPAIGEVNGDRSNHRYGIIAGEPRKYGACDFEFEHDIVEPADRIKGDIARIQLYMFETYGETLGFTFEPARLYILKEWAGIDPVSDWEIERNRWICNKQGSGNTLISECE